MTDSSAQGNTDSGMRNFITLSKHVRRRYNEKIPFISAMCKLPQRLDVQTHIQKYIEYKKSLIAFSHGK